jgi:predicted outer membrane repeat protein
MKLRYALALSALILIFTIGIASANDNLTDDGALASTGSDVVDELGETEDAEMLESAVSGNTFADIQNAVDKAKDDDVIELSGKYTGSKSPITVSKKITIDGKGATLDGAKKSSIINVKSKKLALKNINFINSKGTAVTSKGCELTIINCTFKNNGGEMEYDKHEDMYWVSGCDYGALFCKKGKLSISDSTFSNNLGAIAFSLGVCDSKLDMQNTVFSNHKFKKMSSGEVVRLENTISKLNNCRFKDNPYVSAFFTYNSTDIIKCTFENNYEGISAFGNPKTLKSGDYVNVCNSTFKNNRLTCIDIFWNCHLNVKNCEFTENQGSAIESRCDLNIDSCRFIDNEAENGAALYSIGKITIKNSLFKGNSATLGGTIYSPAHWDKKERLVDSLEIINSTIVDSSATSNGGAIYASCCNLKLVNTNITTKSSSKRSQIYLEVGSFKSQNSKYGSLKKLSKIKAKVRDYDPIITTFNSGKRFSVSVVCAEKNDDGSYTWLSSTKVKFKVYTGKKYKVYYSKISSMDPYFKIDSSLSIGKHKVVIISCGKYYKFTKKTSTITVKKANTIVKAKKLTAKHKKSKYFKVKVKHGYSKKAIPNLKIKIKVFTKSKAKKYVVKTDKNGVAKINTKKLKRGTHKVTITSKNKNYDVSKKSKIVIK